MYDEAIERSQTGVSVTIEDDSMNDEFIFYKVHSKLAWNWQRTALHKWSTNEWRQVWETLFRVSRKHKFNLSMIWEELWVTIRLCVDGTFAHLPSVSSSRKSSRNLDFAGGSLSHSIYAKWHCHHSENVTVSVTTKFWESEHLTSVSMFSAQEGWLMGGEKKTPQNKGDYAMRVEWLIGDHRSVRWLRDTIWMFRGWVRERLKRNYKDPNHRLASLNGSAYSDSLYNEGDSNSVVRIAVLETR